MKVMTVLGTRPEIIRLSRLIPKLDAVCDHVLVHTGQNFDPALSDVFFRDLGVRAPDRSLGVRADSFGEHPRGSSGPPADPRRYEQRALGHRREAARGTGVSHGGGQPLLRRSCPGGGEPPDHRPFE
jgi:hypothetical protein